MAPRSAPCVAVGGLVDLVARAAQHHRERGAHVALVVDDENLGHDGEAVPRGFWERPRRILAHGQTSSTSFTLPWQNASRRRYSALNFASERGLRGARAPASLCGHPHDTATRVRRKVLEQMVDRLGVAGHAGPLGDLLALMRLFGFARERS